MIVSVGSHRLGTADGVIRIHGKRQIVLEWGAAARDLLLTMDLYSDGGRHIARLRRNDWTFNDNNRFTYSHGVHGFTLTDAQSGQVVLQATIAERDTVVITDGTFHSSTGGDVDVMQEAGTGSVSAA